MIRKTDGKLSVTAADTGMTEGLDRIGVEIGGHSVEVQLPLGLHQGKQGKVELDSSALEKKVIKREGIAYPKDSLSRTEKDTFAIPKPVYVEPYSEKELYKL